jgi:hypothetical protein
VVSKQVGGGTGWHGVRELEWLGVNQLRHELEGDAETTGSHVKHSGNSKK